MPRGADVMDLSAAGATLASLAISQSGGDSIVTLGASQITVAGVLGLTGVDFLFA